MSAMAHQTLLQRRTRFMRNIRNQHHQQVRSSKRQTLGNHLNPPAEVHRLQDNLTRYNIQYFPSEIADILASITLFSNNPQFCRQLKASCLMQDLFEVILGQLSRKSYLQAPALAEMLVTLTSHLLTRAQYFSSLVVSSFPYLFFSLGKYPLNHKILQTVSKLLNYIQLSSPNNNHNNYLPSNIFPKHQQPLITCLVDIYLCSEHYQIIYGEGEFSEYCSKGEFSEYCSKGEFSEYCSKGESMWYQNAIVVLEIVSSLLGMGRRGGLKGEGEEDVLGLEVVRAGLFEGVKMYCRDIENRQLFSTQGSDTQSMSDSTHFLCLNQRQRRNQETQNYYMNLLMDIYLLRAELLSKDEIWLLKGTLDLSLQQVREPEEVNREIREAVGSEICSRTVALKVIKLLYQQVILDDEDLQGIGLHFPSLWPCIEAIIVDFI